MTLLSKKTLSGPEQWKEHLRTDGQAALRALLDGTASLGRLSAAEPEDAVAALLGSGSDSPELTVALDAGCMKLLEVFEATLLQQTGRMFQIELLKLTTLLTIIRRVLPERTVTDLRERYALWSGFFDNFVMDRGLDLRREYFRILALSQDIVAKHRPPAARQLMPLWLSICAESGDFGRYDGSYLRVALIGLRRLPLGDRFDANEEFALQGLARWAVAQRPSNEAFEQEWRLLQDNFPRDITFWQPRVQAVIKAAETELSERTKPTQFKETTFSVAGWWRADVGLSSIGRNNRNATVQKPPERWPREQIMEKIKTGRSLSDLEPEITRLMKDHERYADRTGDVFYLVRTACNIAKTLLRATQRREKVQDGRCALSLAALALEYDPVNVYAWSHIRDALLASGRLADAELVGWEAIRRFPENCQWRSHLAAILAEHSNQVHQAEALLRDAMRIFPKDAPVRNQLATILADDLGRFKDAREILEDTIISDEATPILLRKLSQHRKLRRIKTRTPSLITDSNQLSLPAAAARRQLFLHEAKLATEADIHSFLATAQHDSYVTYVAQRVGVADLPIQTTFALAFDDALRRADPSALKALVAWSRPMERALVKQAIAISEGRIIAFPQPEFYTGNRERLQDLAQALRHNQRNRPSSMSLLNEFSASALSTGIKLTQRILEPAAA